MMKTLKLLSLSAMFTLSAMQTMASTEESIDISKQNIVEIPETVEHEAIDQSQKQKMVRNEPVTYNLPTMEQPSLQKQQMIRNEYIRNNKAQS